MNQTFNPWSSRYLDLDADAIRVRATVTPEPLQGLFDMPLEEAALALELALKSAFFPTEQCCQILQRMIGMAKAHCNFMYSDLRAYVANVQSDKCPLPVASTPLLITGLAGTGKSAIVDAFMRIHPTQSVVPLPEGMGIPDAIIKSPWLARIEARSKYSDVIRLMSGVDSAKALSVEHYRRLAYRDGISQIIADELQFMNGSAANTLSTHVLLRLTYLGIPFIYLANFSLGWRLLRRFQEDQERLLANVLVLHPERPGTRDWIDTLDHEIAIAPEIFDINVARDERDIHYLTFGVKRAVRELFAKTFRRCHKERRRIDMHALEATYESIDFAIFRRTVEALRSHSVTGVMDKRRKDLMNPFSGLEHHEQTLKHHFQEMRNKKVAKAELDAALTGDEKAAFRAIQANAAVPAAAPGMVVPLKPRRKKPNADELKANAKRVLEELD